MSNERTLTDFNRLEANLYDPQVDTVVPEHFKEQYPKLVDFIKSYYEYLDSDGQPTHNLKKMFTIKDPNSTDKEFLDLLYAERVPGISPDTFPSPRFSLLQIPGFLNSKGSKISIDGFFRWFYGTDVEQILPRNSMFIVGQSEIGAESLRFIQDSYFYQVYSILLRTNIPTAEWFSFYKSYLHPAGFAIFTETLFELLPTNSIIAESMPLAIVDSDIAVTSFEFSANVNLFPTISLTGIDSATDTRYYPDRDIHFYNNTIGDMGDSYSNYASIADILNTNSLTFDDSADSVNSELTRIFMSDTIQTLDEDAFPFYDSVGTDVP
tara:strand:- start:7233 stop:8201 length:969 start_codon:yes stop_codon:yes gene_type:complete